MVIVFTFHRASVEGHYVPNGGFLENVVFADPALSSLKSDLSQGNTHPSDVDLNGENIEGEQTDDLNAFSEVDVPLSISEAAEQIAGDVSALNVSDNDSLANINAEEHHNMSTEDVDILLDQCLLQALHTTVKDKDLPLAGSTLW